MKAVCKHVALCGLVTAVVSGCDQPKPNCLTAQAPFALKLEEMSRSGTCTAENGPASFYEDPHVGITPYYARDKKGQPDYRKGSIAIKTAELANLVSTFEGAENAPALTPEPVLFSLGEFTTEEPNDDDMCVVPTLAPTRLQLPAVGAAAPVDVTLTWSNVNVYVTPASFGTQVQADLTDKRGDCTIQYKARGLAPAVACYRTRVNEDDEEEPIRNPDGTYDVDPTLCSPFPDPAQQRFTGSGISPNANVECDARIGYCVLAGSAFPALK